MEQWEIDERARLEKEVPHGCYVIGAGDNPEDFTMMTGKGGYINFQIEMMRLVKESKSDVDKQ